MKCVQFFVSIFLPILRLYALGKLQRLKRLFEAYIELIYEIVYVTKLEILVDILSSLTDENSTELIFKSVTPERHLFDVMKLIVDSNLTVVPVVDQHNKYLGLITLENIVKHFAETVAITQPGGILVLEMNPRDYSLAEIARLVESENTKILSCFLSSPYGDERIELTLKLSRQDLKHVIATLSRFGYEVKSSFYESEYLDDLKSRYDALMKYLNP
jgi:hypothetical protein